MDMLMCNLSGLLWEQVTSSRFSKNSTLFNSGGLHVEDIQVGSLVEFLEDFQSSTIPNIGIVLEVISFDELLGEDFGRGITWYSVQFGEIDLVVSSEMINLLN
jgi:hypothetical protein